MSRPLHRTRVALAGLCTVALAAPTASAEPLSGVCPDGSMFIVQREADVPCPRAKLVEPSELPPLRPELLPRPYTWHVDHEARNPNNPYNLVDPAEKIRALRAGGPAETPPEASPTGGAAAPPTPRGAIVQLDEQELHDLARLVVLRQQVAPAALLVDDVYGDRELSIELAHSAAFEARIREVTGAGDATVLAFAARAQRPVDFYPNFLVVQGPTTYRPDPERAAELGLLLGEAGAQEAGAVVLGYLVVPARFDPRQPLELWWNDRSVLATLQP